MNSFSALADPNEPIDPTDVEFFKFTSLVPDVRVTVQKGTYGPSEYPASASLIACSSRYGYVAVATTEGFTLCSTKALQNTFYEANRGDNVPLEGDKIAVALSKVIRQIRFSAEEDKLLVATEGAGLLVYKLEDIKTNKAQAQPIHTFTLDSDICDLRPNPEALPNLAAVLFLNNRSKVIDFTSGKTECEIPLDNVTAICWSPKGKQIVCGTLDGGLEHFDMNGARKDTLSIPKAMSAGQGEEVQNRFVRDVLWIENHIFLVLYSRPTANELDVYINDGFIINRKPSTGSEPQYTQLAEIAPIFTEEVRGNHFYMEIIRDFGKEIKHLVIIGNTASAELSVVGQGEDGEWATWQLPETGIVRFPLSEASSEDTYPLGLALDFTADKELPPVDTSEGEKGVKPVPILYYVNDEGHVGAYHCYNVEVARRGESFKDSMATIPSLSSAAANASPAATVSPATSGFSSFVSVSAPSNDSSFAELLAGKSATSSPAASTSGFGSFSSFGTASGGSIPSFSNLGSAPKVPTGFGAKPAATISASPAFGSTTSFGSAVTNKSATPAFGSTTSFGSAATNKSATPAFGSTTSFGSAATNKSATPAFGSTTSFGSAVTNKSATPAFGSTSFGSVTTSKPAIPSGIDKPLSAFGSVEKKEQIVPESKSTTGLFSSAGTAEVPQSNSSLFSSTKTSEPAKPTTSLFGSVEKKPESTTAPVSGFGSTSTLGGGFGSTSTLGGGFGSLSKNTVPGAKSPSISTSAFGSTSTLGGGFGSFGKPATIPAASTAAAAPVIPAFGSTSSLGSSSSSSFGSLAKNTVPNATSPSAAPAFGSPSPLGSDSLPKNVASAATPTFGSSSTLGGGFGSLAKNTIPGATAPKTPSFGSSSSLGGFTFGSSEAKAPVQNASIAPTSTSAPTPTPVPAKAVPLATAVTAPKPMTTPALTPAPTPVKSTTAESAASTAPSTSTQTGTKEKLKATAAEGMAKEFECLYIDAEEEMEQLKEWQTKVTDLMNKNNVTLQTKSKQSLNDLEMTWNLRDISQFGTIADEIGVDITKEHPNMADLLNKIESLSDKMQKLMDKKTEIERLIRNLGSRAAEGVNDRELDVESKNKLTALENRFQSCENILKNLDFKVQEISKRNIIASELPRPHRAVCDIEKSLSRIDKNLKELEGKLANIKLNDSKAKAQHSFTGFTCKDLSDSEEEEDKQINYDAINYATRYLRRFNFLNTVCNETSTRGPLEATTQ